jgi:hypothetical protein
MRHQRSTVPTLTDIRSPSNKNLGILQHAWRTKRVFLQDPESLSNPSLQFYLASKASTIRSALLKWRRGWPENLLDYELFPVQPTLYQDRAEACWYLAGILTLQHVAIAIPPKTPDSHADRLPLSVYDMLGDGGAGVMDRADGG